MGKIDLAIVGCGGMAKSHAARFERVLDRVRVVWAVDTVPERAEAVAAQFDGARWTTDYREAVDGCDAALLVLPHHLHHPIGMEFLAAGKHVLMEKPLANSERECLELIRAARAARRVLMTAYVMRYHPLVRGFKRLLDERALGEPFQVSIWTEQLTHYPDGHWALSAANLGGGQLFSHGCHYIDLMLWMLGRPLDGSHAGTNHGTPWMEKEGTSNVSLRFASGALGYHFGTWGARGTRLGYTFHAHCTSGLIEADFAKNVLSTIVDGKPEAVPVETGGLPPMSKPTDNEMMHFLDCVETGAAPLTDGPSSLQGLRVIWRLYEAEPAGRVADLRGLGLDQVGPDGALRT